MRKLDAFFFSLIIANDVLLVELIHSIFAIAWGVWILLPIVKINTVQLIVGRHDYLLALSVISSVLGTTWLMAIISSKMWTARRFSVLALCVFWLLISVLHFSSTYYSSSMIVFPFLAIGQAFLYWRSGYNRYLGIRKSRKRR